LTERVECAVIGAGAVGLSIASKLAELGKETVVIEQHPLIGSEISSRNSEVIHAGIYYPQDSLKAQMCLTGKQLMYAFCEEYNVAFKRCGKIIVASTEEQITTMKGYIDQARKNQVNDLYWIGKKQLERLEPSIQGVGAVVSPSTGIVDSHAYMISLLGRMERHGGLLACNSKVLGLESTGGKNYVHLDGYTMQCEWLINCAGLSAPALAKDTQSPSWNVPTSRYARGHYYTYSGNHRFSHLIYPIASTDGLGVHATLDLAGQVKFGPDVQWIDSVDYTFDDSRFNDFVTSIRTYFPDLDEAKLHPSYTGVRPKIAAEGSGFVDFRIDCPEHHGCRGRINLMGIESPGLTASLAIAQYVATVIQH
jgi:L-2-hydroxyglutarate oxidase LhgO